MTLTASLIGFGEAGRAFAAKGMRAFDSKTKDTIARGEMQAAYTAGGVQGCDSAREALIAADVALSLVTADQACAAARGCAPFLRHGALWLDMNSVAPGTKRHAAQAIETVGGRYVDVAVMAPVLPAGRSVPLLVAGPHADAAMQMLSKLGFPNVAIAGSAVGDASAIKMIRSVMVKGLEALSAECVLAAHRAGVSDAVIASLDASWKEQSWAVRFDYNLDRMMAHGLRRAAEMEEVAVTLDELGIDPKMTRGIISRQREMGALGIVPPVSLAAKLTAIDFANKVEAA